MPKTSPSRFTMIPARRSSEPSAKRRARIIMIGLYLAAFCGILAVVVTMARGTPSIDYSEVNPEGRDIADIAAYQAVGGDKVRVPAASSYDPESAEPPTEGDDLVLPYAADQVTWTGWERSSFTGGETTTTFEIHRYVLIPDLDDYVQPVVDGEEELLEDIQSGSQHQSDLEGSEEGTTEEPDGGAMDDEADIEVDGTSVEDGAAEDELDGDPGNVDGAPVEGEEEEPATEDDEAAAEEEAESSLDQEIAEREAVVEHGIHPYVLEVPVLITEDGPRLAAGPSLAPWTDADLPSEGAGDYSNYYSQSGADLTQRAQTQVGSWAVAYVENDQEALLEITGDTDPDAEYLGLGGFTVPDTSNAVQVLNAISVGEEAENVVARVRVLVEDTRSTPEDGESPYRAYLDFDVLITDPETANPSISDWGAPGSAGTLSSFSNRVDTYGAAESEADDE